MELDLGACVILPPSTVGRVRAVGCDLEPVARIGSLVRRHDTGTLGLVFTREEQARYRATADPDLAFTASWATKEATAKALGTGFVRFPMHAIVTQIEAGRAFVELLGVARETARERQINRWFCSWRWYRDMVFAHVIAE